jgi:hypothetical protein
MKLISILFVLLMASACTSMKAVEMSPEQLQQKVSAGEVIKVGDSVLIATADGQNHKFKVTALTADRVSGKDIQIPVIDILAVKTRKFSGGKTAALTAGGIGLLYVIGSTIEFGALMGAGGL